MRKSLLFLFVMTAAWTVSSYAQQMPGMGPFDEMGNPRDPKDPKFKKKYVPKDKITSGEYKLSNDRVDQIQAVVKARFDRHENLEDPAVKSSIEGEIRKFVPLTPAKKADLRTLPEIKETLTAQVDRKFSKTADQVRDEAKLTAEKKYPLAQKNEQVKIYYRRGREIHSYSGYYYGFGVGGNSLQINSRHIPLFDLIPESRARFDKKVNTAMREEFVDRVVRDYLKERLNYSERLFAQEYAKVRKYNEDLGYIYLRSSWEPASVVLAAFLKDMIKESKIRAERERIEKAMREKAKRDAGGGMGRPNLPENGNPEGQNMPGGEGMGL